LFEKISSIFSKTVNLSIGPGRSNLGKTDLTPANFGTFLMA